MPVLVDGDIQVWESLAILEYLAEKFPAAKLWPADAAARAHARAVSSEMHAGFVPLRRRSYVFLQGTLLATSVILLGLTLLIQETYGELTPWLKASQLMLAIPLCLLFEITLLYLRYMHRGKAAPHPAG